MENLQIVFMKDLISNKKLGKSIDEIMAEEWEQLAVDTNGNYFTINQFEMIEETTLEFVIEFYEECICPVCFGIKADEDEVCEDCQ